MDAKSKILMKYLMLMITITTFLALSGCFVVVRHSDLAKDNGGAADDKNGEKYSAEVYCNEQWDNVVANIKSRSIDALTLLAAVSSDVDAAGDQYGQRAQDTGSAWNFGLTADVKVLSVNTEKKTGNLDMDVFPYDGVVDFKLQIGPVFRTNSIRDFTEFINFNDFKNQIEYANITSAFNNKVETTVVGPMGPFAVGDEFKLTGVFTYLGSANIEDILVIPVAMEKVGV